MGKNVAVVPSATDEQISLVKTTRVSVHASPSKRRGKKANEEEEEGCDCFTIVIHQRSKRHAELKLDLKIYFRGISFLFRRRRLTKLCVTPKEKRFMRIKKTEGQVKWNWLKSFIVMQKSQAFYLIDQKMFFKNTFVTVTITIVEISALCLVCVASWCWGKK